MYMFNIISYREFLMRIAETTNEAYKHSTSEPVSNNVDTEKNLFESPSPKKIFFRHKSIYIWRQWTLQASADCDAFCELLFPFREHDAQE